MSGNPSLPNRALLTVAIATSLLAAGCVGLPVDNSDGTETIQPDAQPNATEDANGTSDGSPSADSPAERSDNRTETDPETNGTEQRANETEEEQPPGPRTIEHAAGETTLDGHVQRVVALEFNHVENVLALGMQPVGVADKDGYQKWVDAGVELDDAVEDVGTRAEPSLEKIATLEPHLILAIEFRHEGIYEDLSAIAPTLLFESFPERNDSDDQFDRMLSIFDRTAKATARQERGDRVVEDMRDHFARVKERLDAFDKTGREILVSQLFTYQGQPLARVFLPTSIGGNVAERIGLENAWTKFGCSTGYGYCDVSKEGFADVQHADFFYQAQPDDDPVQDQWSDDPVWNSYEFVREDRVYPLGADAWLFGGPLVSQKIADRIAHHYLG